MIRKKPILAGQWMKLINNGLIPALLTKTNCYIGLGLFFVFLNILCFGQAATREPYFDRIMSENIKIERGISQNSIVSIVQDKMGFMWFGTFDGLNRFDGYEFTIFNKEQGLSNEAIRCLFQTGDTLWVGTEFGLNRINLDNDHIDQFLKQGADSASLTDNWINSIYSDHEGRLWICTANGLNVKESIHSSFRPYTGIESKYGLYGLDYNCIIQDEGHNYYIGTNQGLFFVEAETQSITRFSYNPLNGAGIPDDQINALIFDNNQQLYVGTKKGLVSFSKENKTFHRLDLTSVKNKALDTDEITCLTKEANAGIWIGTYGNGVFFIQNETKVISCYCSKAPFSFSLSNNRVLSIYQGNEGIIWVGTFNGLNKLDRNAPKFRSYKATLEYLSGFSSNQVWSFFEYSPTELLVGTDNGMSIFDKSKGTYRQSDLFNGPQVGLLNKQIRCIFKDAADNFWIGTHHNGLYRYDPRTGQHWNYCNNPAVEGSISDNFILDIVEDIQGRIWVATGNGLNRIDRNRKEFIQYYDNDSDINALADNKIYDLFINRNGQLWVSTADGLAMYNEKMNDFTTYKIPAACIEQNKTGTNNFYSVLEDHEGVIWLGSRGGGLVRFDRDKNEFRILSVKDGLPDNVVYLVLEDRFNDLWITTNWGLSRYDPVSQIFTNFDVTDGLQCNEFNWNAGLIASDGEIFVGGMNGFNAFYPEEIKTHCGKQSIQITSFKKFNIPQKQTFHDGDTLWLNHDDNFFSFGFSALDFTNPSKNSYRYQLGNYDTKWIEKKAENRVAEYTRVPPGTYQFRLMASTVGGKWPEKGMTLTIVITPPWYSTWYFRVIVVILTGILFYVAVVIRMRFIKKKHETEKQYFAIEKKLYQLEQKALQLQMNPHFLFNSLNSIQGLILGNEIDGAIHYLSKFSQLMRRTLSNSSESFVPLQDEINVLKLYIELESLRFADRFDFKIEIDPKIDQEFIEIPPMILQPYVENAIVHGLLNRKGKGQLLIELMLDDRKLRCVIQDDGIGRKRATEIRQESGIERKSKGMSITSERLAILNQFANDIYSVKIIDLFDDLGNASGTRVEVDVIMKI
jgi:ligand-binding sensor domain-containing protein